MQSTDKANVQGFTIKAVFFSQKKGGSLLNRSHVEVMRGKGILMPAEPVWSSHVEGFAQHCFRFVQHCVDGGLHGSRD